MAATNWVAVQKIRIRAENRGGIVTRMSKRFYVNCPLGPGRVTLEGPEAHHLAAVSRLRPGDLVCLFNGDGHEYPARVVSCGRKSVALDVLGMESPQRELPFRMEIAAPLPKGDRGQFLIEKLTELGAAAYVPLRTERSVVHPGETRLEKLQRLVIEASKQCGRNVLMQVTPVTDWVDYCVRESLPLARYLAHPAKSGDTKFHEIELDQDMSLAVGPEGGFTDEEIRIAQERDWEIINLGARTLRIETTVIALAASLALGRV
jgi:16S rRNA (uracil1498-N3)-methyltransferase